MTRDELLRLPSVTETLRQIRYCGIDAVAELADDELAHAAQWLRACSYSALEGARRLDYLLIKRNRTQQGATNVPTD